MVDLSGYDANKHEPMGDFTPIPAGDYVAMAVGSDTKDNSKGTGQYLRFDFEVLEGEYKGRRLFSILNLWNPSSMAVQIAQSELSSICRAAGVMTPRDSAELHDRPMILTVVIEERDDKPGTFSNKIKGYGPREAAGQQSLPPPTTSNSGVPPPHTDQDTPAPSNASRASSVPPWKR